VFVETGRRTLSDPWLDMNGTSWDRTSSTDEGELARPGARA